MLHERRPAAEGEALDVVRRRRAVAPIDQPLRDDAGRQLGIGPLRHVVHGPRPARARRPRARTSPRSAEARRFRCPG